jgi:hypothetical protein
MSLMAETSLAVNWFGTLLGQLATSGIVALPRDAVQPGRGT